MTASNATTVSTQNADQAFLDAKQYSQHSLLKYEFIFGNGFISTGGIETTRKFFERDVLKQHLSNRTEATKVLDVGCGIGGGDKFLVDSFPNVEVLGLDLASNCVEIAKTRYADNERLKFEVADALTYEIPEESLDMCYSRDTILHIATKQALFEKLFTATKPGGLLFITDYCHETPDKADCSDEAKEEWRKYVESRGYTLYTVQQYGETLQKAGWELITAEDVTSWFRAIMLDEKAKVEATGKENLSEEDIEELVDGWARKVVRIDAGLMKWGCFIARKPN
jgi:phosphoethanolamine N-methyltransferase